MYSPHTVSWSGCSTTTRRSSLRTSMSWFSCLFDCLGLSPRGTVTDAVSCLTVSSSITSISSFFDDLVSVWHGNVLDFLSVILGTESFLLLPLSFPAPSKGAFKEVNELRWLVKVTFIESMNVTDWWGTCDLSCTEWERCAVTDELEWSLAEEERLGLGLRGAGLWRWCRGEGVDSCSLFEECCDQRNDVWVYYYWDTRQ